jgi:hypothetical protein
MVEQTGDGRAYPPVAPGGSSPGSIDRDADRLTQRITGGVEYAAGQVVGVKVYTQHWPTT